MNYKSFISKENIEKVQEHILEYYTKEKLQHQVDYMRMSGENDISCCKRLVLGGCFLVSHHDVNEFLKSLDVKICTDEKNWERYCNTIVSNCIKIIND